VRRVHGQAFTGIGRFAENGCPLGHRPSVEAKRTKPDPDSYEGPFQLTVVFLFVLGSLRQYSSSPRPRACHRHRAAERLVDM